MSLKLALLLLLGLCAVALAVPEETAEQQDTIALQDASVEKPEEVTPADEEKQEEDEDDEIQEDAQDDESVSEDNAPKDLESTDDAVKRHGGHSKAKGYYGVFRLLPFRCRCRRGPRGPRGHRGPRGRRGLRGPRGLRGVRGPRGPRGSRGARGPRGLRGAKGQRGPRGGRGPRGLRGARGATGQRGVRGPRGARGPRGPAGPGRRLYCRPVSARGNRAQCPRGFTVTSCSCGHRCGSWNTENGNTRCYCHIGCMNGNKPLDWTLAVCCKVV